MSMQDGGTSLLEETARKQGESDGDQDDGTSRSDGDHLLSSSPDQVMTQDNVMNSHPLPALQELCTCTHAPWLQVQHCGFALQKGVSVLPAWLAGCSLLVTGLHWQATDRHDVSRPTEFVFLRQNLGHNCKPNGWPVDSAPSNICMLYKSLPGIT